MTFRLLVAVLLGLAEGLQDLRGLELLEEPPSSLEKLRSLVNSGSGEDRVKAAQSEELQQLVAENNTEAIDLLRVLAQDSYSAVKRAVAAKNSSALSLLVDVRPQEAAQVLMKLTEDMGPNVRAAVVQSSAFRHLVDVRPQKVVDMLTKLVGDKHPLVRAAAAGSPALGRLVDVRPQEAAKVMTTLAEHLHPDVWEVVAQSSSALRRLCELNPPEGAEVIVEFLEKGGREGTTLRKWKCFTEYASPLAKSFKRKVKEGTLEEKVNLAKNESWRVLLNWDLESGRQLFTELFQEDPSVRQACIRSPAWTTLFMRDVKDALDRFEKLGVYLAQDLQDVAAEEKAQRIKAEKASKEALQAKEESDLQRSRAEAAQKEADEGRVAALRAKDESDLQRSRAEAAEKEADEKRVAALRAKNDAETAMRKAAILLAMVLVLAVLLVILGAAWRFQAWFLQRKYEKLGAAESIVL